jgi:TonB family protein
VVYHWYWRAFQGILNGEPAQSNFDFAAMFFPMYHDEGQSEHHLERANLGRVGQPVPLSPPDEEAQRRRMLIALGILLLALGAVIVRDWDFWFPSRGETPAEAVARLRKAVAQPESPSAPAAAATHERKNAKTAAPAPVDAPFTATTQRAVLPALQVEVVAGNRRVSVPAKNTVIHVDVGASGTPPASSAMASGASATSGTTGATTHSGGVSLSPQAAQSVSVSVPPDYPLLARQMKVQGAVSLQALIARDGTIQQLEILSGPEILATAAREAVKQWHFKPYLQNGQPVETQARITVNFTISTN